MQKAKTVDEYIAGAPKEIQDKLKQMRQAIKEVAPGAEEKISYGMPYYGYKGRLVYFAYFKNHIGFYAVPPLIEDHKNELKQYQTATSTIHFPLNKDLPITLIKKLVTAAAKNNEMKQKK